MSHPTTPTATLTPVTPDTASIYSLASTISVNWKDGNKGNTDPPASTTVESRGEAGTKTGSLIIRNLFIIGFLIPLAWVIAVIKVFLLDRSYPSSPRTPTSTTSAAGKTDIEANIPRREEKYCEGLYWAYLCLVAGTVYIVSGMAIAWIICVEKQRWGA